MGERLEQLASSVTGSTGGGLLAADVGGTYARIALVRQLPGSSAVDVLAYQKYQCADYASLHEIVCEFLGSGQSPGAVPFVLACAGCLVGDAVINANLPWPVSVRTLRESLSLNDLHVINDFEAVAHAVPLQTAAARTVIAAGSGMAASGPQIVVGPGTGLGSAALLPEAAGYRVLPAEAGQIALAPGNELEMRILGVLARHVDHVSAEQALSGPGLLNLYRALCVLDQAQPTLDTPEGITRAALRTTDPRAVLALETFCAMLGSFVGDLAMLFGAGGGIWLTGGIVPKFRDFLCRSAFLDRFLAKGGMRTFLETVPVYLMEHGQLGVIGAAGWYFDRLDRTGKSIGKGGDTANDAM